MKPRRIPFCSNSSMPSPKMRTVAGCLLLRVSWDTAIVPVKSVNAPLRIYVVDKTHSFLSKDPLR